MSMNTSAKSFDPCLPAGGRRAGTGFGQTARKDFWWVEPLCVAVGLGLFGVYSTWAAFQGNHYFWGPYLSPFYSPELFGDSPHALLGPKPGWWPSALPFSPALLILWMPLGFRGTCYYYRKAYYRAFFQNPTACAVGKPWTTYCGETEFPLIVQNLHRYFLYLAIVVLSFLWIDGIKAFTRAPGKDYIAGVGSFVLLFNAFFLTMYTFGCHSLRHLVGGHLDCFSDCSKSKLRHEAWKGVTCLNERHMLWAWISLTWVGASDLYVRLLSMGKLTDLKLF